MILIECAQPTAACERCVYGTGEHSCGNKFSLRMTIVEDGLPEQQRQFLYMLFPAIREYVGQQSLYRLFRRKLEHNSGTPFDWQWDSGRLTAIWRDRICAWIAESAIKP